MKLLYFNYTYLDNYTLSLSHFISECLIQKILVTLHIIKWMPFYHDIIDHISLQVKERNNKRYQVTARCMPHVYACYALYCMHDLKFPIKNADNVRINLYYIITSFFIDTNWMMRRKSRSRRRNNRMNIIIILNLILILLGFKFDKW